MTNTEIEKRRDELEKLMADVGYTDTIQAEWEALFNMEMLNNMENAMAIAKDTNVIAYISYEFECGYALNTKENGKWDYKEGNLESTLKAFKTFAEAHEIKKVLILPYLLNADEVRDIDHKAEQYAEEEAYLDACMAEAHGDNSLMKRYERDHGIEKDYGPSNPWDAPGMSVHDFI